MIIWCDHCLLVAFWFRFHTELDKSPLFGSTCSDLIPKCEQQKPLRTRRERSGATQASLLYNLVVAWIVWNTFCFFVWHIVMTAMSTFWRLPVWRYTAHCMANDLACWHLSLLHPIDSMAMPQTEAGRRHYLAIYLRAEYCVIAITIGIKTSNDLYTCFRSKKNNCVLVTYTTRKRLAYGCLCMLIPKHTVSSRDQCVVIGIMTGKESTVLTGLL